MISVGILGITGIPYVKKSIFIWSSNSYCIIIPQGYDCSVLGPLLPGMLMGVSASLLLAVLVAHVAPVAALANKYAKFSKADKVREGLSFSNTDKVAPSSAADAVAAAAEPEPRDRSRWVYPDAAEIDQRDPATFGFTEIGTILGAHGTRGELKVSSDSDFAHERLCKPGLTWVRRRGRRAPREETVVRGRKGPGTNIFLLTLGSVGSREEAAALRGATLHVRRELRPSLGTDEVLLWELEGLDVVQAVRLDDGAAVIADTADAAARYVAGDVLGRVTGAIPREELTGSRDLGNDLLEVTLVRRPDDEHAGDGDQALDASMAAEEGDVEEMRGDQDQEQDGLGEDSVLVPFVPQIVIDVRLEEGVLLVDPPKGLFDLVQPKRAERVVIRGLLPARAQSLAESRGETPLPGPTL